MNDTTSALVAEPRITRIGSDGTLDLHRLAGVRPHTRVRMECSTDDEGNLTELRVIPTTEPRDEKTRYAAFIADTAMPVLRHWAKVTVNVTDSDVSVTLSPYGFDGDFTVRSKRIIEAAYQLANDAEDRKFIADQVIGNTARELYWHVNSFGTRGRMGAADANAVICYAAFGELTHPALR